MRYENEIREILFNTVAVTEPADSITIETNLHDAGMDSLSFVRLVIEIEDFFGIEFPDDKLIMSEAGTIKELCEIVDSAKSAKGDYI